MVMSGVASFSPYRRSRGSHAMGVASPRLVDERLGRAQDRMERILVEVRAIDDRDRLVQQAHEGTGEPGLGLAPLPEEHEVLAGEDGVLDRWDDALLVADDAREHRLAGSQRGHEVRAQLLLDAPRRVAAGAQGTQRGGAVVRGWLVHGVLDRRMMRPVTSLPSVAVDASARLGQATVERMPGR